MLCRLGKPIAWRVLLARFVFLLRHPPLPQLLLLRRPSISSIRSAYSPSFLLSPSPLAPCERTCIFPRIPPSILLFCSLAGRAPVASNPTVCKRSHTRKHKSTAADLSKTHRQQPSRARDIHGISSALLHLDAYRHLHHHLHLQTRSRSLL